MLQPRATRRATRAMPAVTARSRLERCVCDTDTPVACAWEELEAQAERVNQCSGRRRGQLECEVRSPRQPVVGTMLGYLGRVEVGRGEQKEDA
jgi:hypothetical protein